MGSLIKIKKEDPAYDKAFKHGAMFAMFVYAFMAMVFHDPFLAISAFAGSVVIGIA